MKEENDRLREEVKWLQEELLKAKAILARVRIGENNNNSEEDVGGKNLLEHLYHYMCLSIRLDSLFNGVTLNFDKVKQKFMLNKINFFFYFRLGGCVGKINGRWSSIYCLAQKNSCRN